MGVCLCLTLGPSEEEERLAKKVKKLESELAKVRKDSDAQKSIEGTYTCTCTCCTCTCILHNTKYKYL